MAELYKVLNNAARSGTGSIPGSNYFSYWRQVTGAKAARVSLVSCIATFDKTRLLQPKELHQASLHRALKVYQAENIQIQSYIDKLTPFLCNLGIQVSVNFVNFSLSFIGGT